MKFHSNDYRRALESLGRDYPENFGVVQEFAEDLLASGVSELRVYSYMVCLKRILSINPEKVEEWGKRDVRSVVNRLQLECREEKISENYLLEVKKTLKKFFKWMGKEESVSWFTTGGRKSNVSPHDLITEEEFNAMMNACMNSRDRALISLLYETGARVGEIGSMRVKDVSFDDHGAVVWLPKSKTVKRRLRVVYSARYLSEWLSDHPTKDPERELWVKLAGKNRHQGMVYDDIRVQTREIAKRAGINRRIYMHLFRHTRATKLLTKVSESIGAKYMGWIPGSNMVRTYVHLANEDVDEAILQMHGIKTNENRKDLEVRQCPRCTQINPGSRYCTRCGLPLNEEAAQEVQEWENRKTEALNQLSNPDMLQMMMGMQQEINKLKGKLQELKEE